jgi:glycosyltransferase involved in cell wall biosynthesis
MITVPDEALKAQLGLSGAVVLGFLGSLYGYEGLDLLVSAMPRLLEERPDARLLLVGGGPEEANLRHQVAVMGLEGKVHMIGRVPHADVARYYSIVDLLVFPRKSTRLTELVTPLKPLEAMAQGRLILASNVGGHRELIDDEKTGFMFEPDSPDAIVRRVSEVLDRIDACVTVVRQGRQLVEHERNWRVSVARYERVYADAISRVRGP